MANRKSAKSCAIFEANVSDADFSSSDVGHNNGGSEERWCCCCGQA
jgi:hypothetical protein